MWIVWANRYPDGSTDYGLVIGGPENWNVCFYIDGKQLYTLKHNTMDITWVKEGYPLKADVAMDHNRLRFQWHCERLILEVQDTALWAQAQMINLAKKDKPVDGYAWFEDILFHKKDLPYAVMKFPSSMVRYLPDAWKSRLYDKMFSRGLKAD